MKIVCDSNIFISGFIFGGNPERIIKSCRERKLSLVVSPEILNEVARILKEKFRWNKNDIERAIISVIKISEVVRPEVRVNRIRKDQSDNRVLECAVFGKVDYIVTGDKKHLLPLKKYRGVSIISPGEFLKKVLYS